MTSFRQLLGLILATATGFVQAHDGGAQKPLTPGDECHHPAYTSHIISKSPLVIYLDGFLTAEERAHLTEVT